MPDPGDVAVDEVIALPGELHAAGGVGISDPREEVYILDSATVRAEGEQVGGRDEVRLESHPGEVGS